MKQLCTWEQEFTLESFHIQKRFADMSLISGIKPVIATQEFFWSKKLIID